MNSNREYIADTREILRQSSEEKAIYPLMLNGHLFEVFPGVFSPKYFADSQWYALQVPVEFGESFCEMGCGTGIVAVMAALRGAGKVTATDVNPLAMENTLRNAKLNNVDHFVSAYSGDLFENVPKQKFDSIFWNIPFGDSAGAPTSMLERAVFDEDYTSFSEFASVVRTYMSPWTKLYLGFSPEIGDVEKFKRILTSNYFTPDLIARKTDLQVNPEGAKRNFRKISYELYKVR